MKKIIFNALIIMEISILLIGFWLMVVGYNGHSPEQIAKAMTTFIIMLAIPIFMVIE